VPLLRLLQIPGVTQEASVSGVEEKAIAVWLIVEAGRRKVGWWSMNFSDSNRSSSKA